MLLQAQPKGTIVAQNLSAPTSSTPSATSRPPVARNRLPLCPQQRTFRDPRWTSACDLGIAYSAKGRHNQAIKDYSEAIHLSPNHAWAYNNRCWSYGLLHRAEVALHDCDEALSLATRPTRNPGQPRTGLLAARRQGQGASGSGASSSARSVRPNMGRAIS